MVRTRIIFHAILVAFAVAGGGLAHADGVPDLNVDPVCHGIAAQASSPGERGAPDLAFSECVKNEGTVRQQLIGEWSTFVPADKANCIGSEQSALPSYTDLLTCLEMARDVRQLNK
jgi:hypothetical protein